MVKLAKCINVLFYLLVRCPSTCNLTKADCSPRIGCKYKILKFIFKLKYFWKFTKLCQTNLFLFIYLLKSVI